MRKLTFEFGVTEILIFSFTYCFRLFIGSPKQGRLTFQCPHFTNVRSELLASKSLIDLKEKWQIHDPYEYLIENSKVYFNPDYPIMDISTSLHEEVLRTYCKYLADPACCIRRLIAREFNEDILQAIEANHSITALHFHNDISDADLRRAIKHKDLQLLTVKGTFFKLNHSTELDVIPTRIPYGELAIWQGFSAFVEIDPEPFLTTASQLSSLNFYVSQSNTTLVRTLFDRFATFSALSRLSIGIGTDDDATVPAFWTAAAEFVRKSTSIRKFSVRCDGIDHIATHDLVREMAHNTRITHFSISCNGVTDELCKEIAAMIRTNTHLKRLKIAPKYSFKGQTSTIADALKENKTLKKITLLGCNDCYDYLVALLENTSITSFKSDSWDCLVKHCMVIAKILERNIIQSISIPMRFTVNEPEVYEALKSNTSLRRFHLNIELHPMFKEKRLMSVQYAPFNIDQLNSAIEMLNLSPQCCFDLKYGYEEDMALITTANNLLAEKMRARTLLLRYWAVYLLQTFQLFTARDMGLLSAIPVEIRRLIVRSIVPAYVLNSKQLDFISNFATREKLQDLVKIQRAMDLSAYDDLKENFLYNLLLLR